MRSIVRCAQRLGRALRDFRSSSSRLPTQTLNTPLRSIFTYTPCQSHLSLQHLWLISRHFYDRFPRTYPANAHPIFTVQQPIKGISDDHVTKLSNFIRAEARQSRGTEIVFQVGQKFENSRKTILYSCHRPVILIAFLYIGCHGCARLDCYQYYTTRTSCWFLGFRNDQTGIRRGASRWFVEYFDPRLSELSFIL